MKYEGVPDRLGTSAFTYSLCECSYCGLGLINPAPTGDLSPYYPAHYLSQEESRAGSPSLLSRAERLYRYNQYAFDFKLLARASNLSLREADSYIDIGCGSGERVSYASELGCARAVGIDRYEFAKQSSRESVELITTEITDFRPAQRFQVASMFHVLEHVEDPVGVLRHIRNAILSEGGLVIVQVPNYGSIERRIFGRRWFGLDAPRHLFQFDSRTGRMVLEKAGFEVMATFAVNATFHPVTLVPSLVPALDVQRIWAGRGSSRSKFMAQVVWVVATAVAVPVCWMQNMLRTASMLTLVARPARVD